MQFRFGLLLAAIVIGLALIRTGASYVIEYQWWREMGQVPTWLGILLYRIAPTTAAALLTFAALWIAHARGMKFGGTRLGAHRTYAKLSTLALLLLSLLVSAVLIDAWTVVRYFGGRGDTGGWSDPVFGKSLAFYLFELPFYSMMLRVVLTVAVLAALVHWLTARGWRLRYEIPDWTPERMQTIELRITDAFESPFVRGVAAMFVAALAIRFFLQRYDLLYNEHGFMMGVDYVDERIRLPLLWVTVVASLIAAAAILVRKPRFALILPVAWIALALVPRIVNYAYVRPNEISIQKPYIERHIAATRAAYGLSTRVREIEFPARLEARIDPQKHRPLLDNVRLWDWRAFHDTVAQIQALRPYYVFSDSDVDRYTLGGQLRQVLLTPRELDIRQLPDAQTRWINPHFIYTHGYGMVMAEAARITPDGLPSLIVQDAPPIVESPDLKLTRPEIYYGEITHEPVFVRTGQPEFNYPSGSENVHSRYDGRGGFPVSSLPMRAAAALSRGDWNILLTNLLTPESRMMIRRDVKARVAALAGFLSWDRDPYLVVTSDGRLVWMLDGYTTSARHPYSRAMATPQFGYINYIRNSVKATIDAYDGTVHLYIYDPGDPVIRAYARLFPQLLEPVERMPEGLRLHARYPESIFVVQSEIYRTYHMLDPEAFYNKEDVWDIAKNVSSQSGRAEAAEPTYVVATVPGETQPEFLLMRPFTPRNKDNLIGMMVARCDGPNLGELVFLQLSKQALIFGPMQIEARINQDQNIAKDLALWNQQGSQVLRGQMLVLPIEDTFLYVEPIYIQSSQARMPQLKKVVLAMGNTLIYTDTYEQAVAQLAGLPPPEAKPEGPETTTAPMITTTAAPAAPLPVATDNRVERVRQHLRRYRELSGQGRWAEAGKELEAAEAALK
jgi:uncharacterized membrane protein (UPF0182 family)